ncbi:LacI family DNA-binding transcriptional regulator, partial [Streptosporangium fragile]|uniref:LacI family DNA-binding transcriptional regulator n=1 Tax=Streptosporangium fragile TaxID=46186 RepID=UPI0031EF768F
MPDDATGAARPKKRATIQEVAKLAGVSHQTVSRYFRRSGGLRPRTVASIERAVAELDYRPNLAARSMRTRKSNRIVVVLPDLTNFIPAPILRGASAAAHEADYLLDVIGLEGGQESRAERVLSLLDSAQADGILSFTPLGRLVRDRAGT